MLKNLKCRFSKVSMIIFMFLLFNLIIGLAGCNKVSMNDLKGVDGKKAIAIANDWAEKKYKVTSGVTSDAVHFRFPDKKKISIPILNQKMYVAIAPYINKTHTWSIHSISGCRSEIVNQLLNVVAKDTKGNELFNGSVKTLSNGFFEIWLPRNLKIELSIDYKGKKSVGEISTFNKGKTCVTTFKLT